MSDTLRDQSQKGTSVFDNLTFADADSRLIAQLLKNVYEEARRANGELGYSMGLADPIRLVQLGETAALTQVHSNIDYTGKQNLLYFAKGANLDAIGYLFGSRGARLQASPALCTVRYSLAQVRGVDTLVPKGSRVTADNLIYFATIQDLTIKAGQLYGEVTAQCQTSGTVGNNYDIDDIKNMVDLVPFVVAVTNITAPSGGGDTEDDEQYRDRIRQLPESFSVAGPDGAYEAWALSADPSIIDAKAYMPDLEISQWTTLLNNFLAQYGSNEIIDDDIATQFYKNWGKRVRDSGTGPGNVNLAILIKGGNLPSQEMLDKVYALLTKSGSNKRPLTDFLHVIKPEIVEYNIEIEYDAGQGDQQLVLQNINDAIEQFVRYQKSKLGISINDSLLRDLLTMAGAYRVRVISPAYQQLQPQQFSVLVGDPIINGITRVLKPQVAQALLKVNKNEGK